MSYSFDPRGDYERQHSGEAGGLFEIESRIWVSPVTLIAVAPAAGVYPEAAVVTLDMSKPDFRLGQTLEIQFSPTDDVPLTFVTSFGTALSVRLALSTIWLSNLGDLGGLARPIRNIQGTEGTPVSLVTAGLWGYSSSPQALDQTMRAVVTLRAPGVPGAWYARSRLTAQYPMSQRDWEHARQNMSLLNTPRQVPNLAVGP